MKFLTNKSLLGAFAAAALAASASAVTINVTSAIGSASVTTGAGTVSITLTNLIQNPTGAVDILTALNVTFSNAIGASSLTGSSGTQVNVAANGSYTTGPAISPTDWILVPLNSTSLRIWNSGADQGIIGFSDAGNYTSGAYSAANNSVAGNGPHNPFLESGATYNLSVAGVTSQTTITSATFFFNTNQDRSTPGTIGTIPPPSVPDSGSALLLSGIGLTALGLAARRFGRKS